MDAIIPEVIQGLFNRLRLLVLFISDIKHLLKCSDSEISERLESILNEKKIIEREIKKINKSSQGSVVEDLVASAENINGYKIVVEQLDNISD